MMMIMEWKYSGGSFQKWRSHCFCGDFSFWYEWLVCMSPLPLLNVNVSVCIGLKLELSFEINVD
jgi:hypothetical protein